MKRSILILIMFLTVSGLFSLSFYDYSEESERLLNKQMDFFLMVYKANDTDAIYDMLINGGIPYAFAVFSDGESVYEKVMKTGDIRCINAMSDYAASIIRSEQKQRLAQIESEKPLKLNLSFYLGTKKLNLPLYESGSKEAQNAIDNNESFIEYECFYNHFYPVPEKESYNCVSSADSLLILSYGKKKIKSPESALNKDVLANTSLKVTYHTPANDFTVQFDSLNIKNTETSSDFTYKYFINFMDKTII